MTSVRGELLGGVLCGLVAFLPGVARAQKVPEGKVSVQVTLVSESGVSVTGATLYVERLDRNGPPYSVVRVAVDSGVARLRLEVPGRYGIRAVAPGHRSRRTVIVPVGPAALRLVLPVDPYELPTLAATAAGGGGPGPARSVSQGRFSEESLTYATVADWLRDVPGVTLRGGGPGGAQLLSIRGSRPEDVLVLLDGIPLNNPLTGRADLGRIPTSTLESGTLVQGTASQRYGAGAGAGVLMLTSRTGRGSGVSGGVRMASFGGLGFDLQADGSSGDRRVGLSLSAARDENDFPLRDSERTVGSSLVRTNADATELHGAMTLTSGAWFGSLRYDRSERGVGGRAGTRVFDDARAGDRSWVMAAGLDRPRVRGSASLGLHRLEYASPSRDVASAQEVGELRVVGDVDLPSTPLVVGARLTREQVRGDALAGRAGRLALGARVAAVLGGPGLRVDPAVSVDVVGDRIEASPELSVSWLPDSRTHVWARIGQGFRLPTFGDMYFSSSYQLRANPDLAPERIAFDSELGAAVRLATARLEIETSASAWARRTEGPIVWLSSSAALWSPRNLGELRARGLDVQVQLSSRPAPDFGWRTQLVGTVQRSRVGFGSNRNPLPYEPGTTARASLEVWKGAAGARCDVRYTGARNTSLAGTRSLEPFTTIDISARRHFEAGSLRIGLFGRIENLLDRRYQLVELYPEPGRHFTLRIEAGRAPT